MKVDEKSLGMLIDELIIDIIQHRAPDETFCASGNGDAIIEMIKDGIDGQSLKEVLPDIIKLTIEHTMIYFNRRFLLYSDTQSEALDAARRVNEINAGRVNLVRRIDSIIDSECLSFSPKTYGKDRIKKRTVGVITDDLISSMVKLQIDDADELKGRVDALSDFLQKELAEQKITAKKLVKLCVAATMCFFVQDVLSHSTVDSEAIKAGRDIAIANGLRKKAIKNIDKEYEND